VSRLVALAIDALVITVAVLAVSHLPVLVWTSVAPTRAPHWFTTACAIAGALTPWAYFTWFWWLNGQTPGDLLIGVYVGRDGKGLSMRRAALRAAIGLLLAPVWLVGLAAILWDHRRRAWHDVLLGTEVRYLVKPAARREAGAD
jgi:hypothetical protein